MEQGVGSKVNFSKKKRNFTKKGQGSFEPGQAPEGGWKEERKAMAKGKAKK